MEAHTFELNMVRLALPERGCVWDTHQLPKRIFSGQLSPH